LQLDCVLLNPYFSILPVQRSRGEKENDLIVSERQKHNGMSWSKDGSVALASLTTFKRNKEATQWFKSGNIDFKLAA
jgi:hypothetical protein